MLINHKVHQDFHKVHKGAIVHFVHSLCSLWLEKIKSNITKKEYFCAIKTN